MHMVALSILMFGRILKLHVDESACIPSVLLNVTIIHISKMTIEDEHFAIHYHSLLG